MNLHSSPIFKQYLKILLELSSLFDKRKKAINNPATNDKIAKKVKLKKSEIEKIKIRAEANGLILPLEKLCQEHGLSDLEKDIVGLLFFQRFLLECRVVDSSGKHILYEILGDPVDVMLNRKVLSSQSKLLRTGIIRVMETAKESEENDLFLLGGLCVGESLVSFLLGETKTWEEGTGKTIGNDFKVLDLPKDEKGELPRRYAQKLPV